EVVVDVIDRANVYCIVVGRDSHGDGGVCAAARHCGISVGYVVVEYCWCNKAHWGAGEGAGRAGEPDYWFPDEEGCHDWRMDRTRGRSDLLYTYTNGGVRCRPSRMTLVVAMHNV